MKRTLKDLAYYKTGGSYERLYEPTSLEELAKARKEIYEQKLPYFFLGAGTNSLIMDEHWSGAVIAFHKLCAINFTGSTAYVEAGVDNSVFSKAALARGLAGAAWMNRLPGQLGATVRMNARCYGGEISQIVTRVVAVSKDGQIKEYKEKNVFRGYKDTIFMENEEAIAAVDIELAPGDAAAIKTQMDFCETDRIGKNQFILPSNGCAFKNSYDVGVPSGMLLQAANVYQLKHPGITINPKHANFVFNNGAKSRDILEFTLKMRELVYQEFGVWLEYEMEILGCLPDDLQARFHEKRTQKWQNEKLAPLRERFQSRSSS